MKIKRRDFIKYAAAAGITVSSGVLYGDILTHADERKKNIIDVHHHILPEVYTRSLAEIGITETNGAPFPQWSSQRAIEAMDRNGISTAITSISAPGIYFGDVSFTVRLARKCNEFSADLIANHPNRFGGFAVLPLPDVEASLKELEYALDTLKLDGVVLLSNVGGDYLGSPHFADLFFELNRRRTPVFIHPTEPADQKFPEMHLPPSFFEFIFDTTRTVASLVQYNCLERYRNIRFILAHAGGVAPYLTWKMELVAQRSRGESSRTISQLQGLYYDTALATSRYTLGFLREFAGDEHIVFGSDSGFAPEFILSQALYELNHCEVFGKGGLEKVYAANAKDLFPRFSKQ